jgi:hypothetical protein
MKKTIETILGLVCFLAVILAGAENPDGSCNFLWTLSCLAIAGLSGWAFGKVSDHKTIK